MKTIKKNPTNVKNKILLRDSYLKIKKVSDENKRNLSAIIINKFRFKFLFVCLCSLILVK